MIWSPEALRELRELWSEGLSASKIADTMGTTKDSIVGKVRHLRLPSRPSPIQPTPQPRTRAIPRAPAQTLGALALLPAAATPAPPPASRCQWPTWTDKDAAYWSDLRAGHAPCCGAPVTTRPGPDGPVRVSYCATHYKRTVRGAARVLQGEWA